MEAPYCTTIRYSLDGFNAQTTLSSHGDSADHLDRMARLLEELQKAGAGPDHHCDNGHKENGLSQGEAPTCKTCHQSDQMELVDFQKNGSPKKAWKCQRCLKWGPDQPAK